MVNTPIGMIAGKGAQIMPWMERGTMSLRMEFCTLADHQAANLSELCRRFGISRTTGYTWLARYRAEGAAGLHDRSRRPTNSPGETSAATVAQVLAIRDAHPTWGGRKLRRRLQDEAAAAPAASTITAILRREDRLDPAASAAHTPLQRFEQATPNALWQMDFKGHVAMAQGRCHPLHMLDDHSRYVVGLVACADERTATVQVALTAIFQQFGLPWRLLCDNGAPWGTVQAEAGLTTLGVWLVRLGITVSHGRPFHPQTQGKLERANRTLKEDVLIDRRIADVTAIPRFTDLESYQRAFDAWRHGYNHERPHEALGLATPSTRYAPSPRPFPETLPPIVYESGDLTRMVHANGRITYKDQEYRVSRALVGQPVALRPTITDGVWEVRFCHMLVRTLDFRGPHPDEEASVKDVPEQV